MKSFVYTPLAVLLLFVAFFFPISPVFAETIDYQYFSHLDIQPALSQMIQPGDRIEFSALAFDKNGSPRNGGVSYEWGISSNGSIGTIKPSATNSKIATLTATGQGQGQLYVIATYNGEQLTKSLLVTVGQSQGGQIPVCLNISRDVAEPVLGQTVTFTCAQVAGASHYRFQYRVIGTPHKGNIGTLFSGSNQSSPFTIVHQGEYEVECSACSTMDCSPLTNW